MGARQILDWFKPGFAQDLTPEAQKEWDQGLVRVVITSIVVLYLLNRSVYHQF